MIAGHHYRCCSTGLQLHVCALRELVQLGIFVMCCDWMAPPLTRCHNCCNAHRLRPGVATSSN